MIDTIVVKDVASYNTNGIELKNIQKINFIYGANASGKTTISNLISNPTLPQFNSCSINWKHNQPLKVLVYNKLFREQNFSTCNKLKGVFTLGKANKEHIELIERKKGELSTLREGINKQKESFNLQQDKKAQTEASFKETCWHYYKKYETDFKEAFKGSLHKETFKNKLLDEFTTNQSNILSLEEIKSKSITIFGDAPVLLSTLPTVSSTRLTEIENDPIWSTKILGKADVDIAALIQSLNMNDWVNQGRAYLSKDDNTCPFCQSKSITDVFRQQLENYFDDSFIESINNVKKLAEEYFLLASNLVNELSQLENSEKNNTNSKLDIDKLSAYLKTITSQLTTNKEYIANKSKEPSRAFELLHTKEQIENISSIITTANIEIKTHNTIVTNFQTERNKLIQAIWKYVAEDAKNDIQQFTVAINGLQRGIDNIQRIIREDEIIHQNLDLEIKNLNKEVTSIQPTIDEINRTLHYYGFHNFEITPSINEKGFYQIQRDDGTLVESTLSEGEITFITFLYFLQLTKGSVNQDSITEDRVIVIDDPISSLDSNVLFIVSTLIKDIFETIKNGTGNIRQILILTHNVYFHKEISFIDGRTSIVKDRHFWILRKSSKVSSIQEYGTRNPIQSSYQLLWEELRNSNKNAGITIQNAMRRIIENYFRILGKYGDDALINKFNTKEEQCICKSLLGWINDGSHSLNDDIFIEIPDNTIEVYLNVFKEIFVKTDNIGHYNMMMGIESAS